MDPLSLPDLLDARAALVEAIGRTVLP